MSARSGPPPGGPLLAFLEDLSVLYTPDAIAVARTAAAAHFDVDPVGRPVTGTCPCCDTPINGICLDAYPACLDDAHLRFDLAVREPGGKTMLLVGDCATLLPGVPTPVVRVEPVPAGQLPEGDWILHTVAFDPERPPSDYDDGPVGWGASVTITLHGPEVRVRLRNWKGSWDYCTYPDPDVLVLRRRKVIPQ